MSSTPPVCPYCGKDAEWLPDSRVYAKSYGGYVYACLACDAHIGCHKNGDHKQSKGTLANQQLRHLRIEAHALFDPLWEKARKIRGWSKGKARNTAYGWLAKELGMSKGECHIGMLRDDDVRRVIAICKRVYDNKRPIAA